jgi:hypothetical protein
MIQQLKTLLAAPDLPERLIALAGNAPPRPRSACLQLGKQDQDWLQLSRQMAISGINPSRRMIFRLRPRLQISSAGRIVFRPGQCRGFCALATQWPRPGLSGFARQKQRHPLPNALLTIPAILLENIGGIAGHLTPRRPACAGHWRLAATTNPAPLTRRKIVAALPMLADRAWIARVNAALRDIRLGTVSKLVLSRQRRIESTQPFSPRQLLGQLIQQQPGSLIYAYGTRQQYFLGATPERLVQLNNCQILADALAGTAWAGSAELAGEKNRHEQSLVVAAVRTALLPFCTQPREGQPGAEPPGRPSAASAQRDFCPGPTWHPTL